MGCVFAIAFCAGFTDIDDGIFGLSLPVTWMQSVCSFEQFDMSGEIGAPFDYFDPNAGSCGLIIPIEDHLWIGVLDMNICCNDGYCCATLSVNGLFSLPGATYYSCFDVIPDELFVPLPGQTTVLSGGRNLCESLGGGNGQGGKGTQGNGRYNVHYKKFEKTAEIFGFNLADILSQPAPTALSVNSDGETGGKTRGERLTEYVLNKGEQFTEEHWKQLPDQMRIRYEYIKNSVSGEAGEAGSAGAMANDENNNTPDMFGIKNAKPEETYSILTIIIIVSVVAFVVLAILAFQYANKRKSAHKLNELNGLNNEDEKEMNETEMDEVENVMEMETN